MQKQKFCSNKLKLLIKAKAIAKTATIKCVTKNLLAALEKRRMSTRAFIWFSFVFVFVFAFAFAIREPKEKKNKFKTITKSTKPHSITTALCFFFRHRAKCMRVCVCLYSC